MNDVSYVDFHKKHFLTKKKVLVEKIQSKYFMLFRVCWFFVSNVCVEVVVVVVWMEYQIFNEYIFSVKRFLYSFIESYSLISFMIKIKIIIIIIIIFDHRCFESKIYKFDSKQRQSILFSLRILV